MVEMENSIYLPEVAELIEKRKMTPLDSFFEFQLKDRSLGHLPGQYFNDRPFGSRHLAVTHTAAFPERDHKGKTQCLARCTTICRAK